MQIKQALGQVFVVPLIEPHKQHRHHITGTAARDVIHGLAGSDLIRGLASDDSCGGDGANDILECGAERDYMQGGPMTINWTAC
jgi:hypothetical protein